MVEDRHSFANMIHLDADGDAFGIHRCLDSWFAAVVHVVDNKGMQR
ncbi:hypothetical protein NT6N_04090 [Oceaniferula spumae]|uniref:Uncharacterized protein n=1 Tax=Oceaniferula spumae TaxID=2979115 RepID=A0AAT9FHD2_9BACT